MIPKKVVSEIRFNGYIHHATREEPQYLIPIDKTGEVAIHKGRALTCLRTPVDHKREAAKESEGKLNNE